MRSVLLTVECCSCVPPTYPPTCLYTHTHRSEIEKLPDSPFKSAFTEWSKLSSLLSRYYNTDSSYISAINPDTGRWASRKRVVVSMCDASTPRLPCLATAELENVTACANCQLHVTVDCSMLFAGSTQLFTRSAWLQVCGTLGTRLCSRHVRTYVMNCWAVVSCSAAAGVASEA